MKLTTRFEEQLNSLTFLLPTIIVFSLFLFGPILYSIYMSFQKWSLLTPPIFIGFGNFIKLFGDKQFWESLKITVEYSLIYVPATTILALFSAVLLNFPLRGRVVFRALFFFPVITSTVVTAVIWKWVLHSDYGILNYFIGYLGIKPIQWLGNPTTALISIIIVNIWRDFGFYTVILLGGLQTIPREIYDSAIVEGASLRQIFHRITVPLLSPTISVVSIMATIFSLQVFDTIYIMTSGGPVNSTTTVGWLIYSQAFKYREMGYASTIGLILFIITFIFSLIELQVLKVDFKY